MSDEYIAILRRRLERLQRLRREYKDDLNTQGIRLLDRAIESTIADIASAPAPKEPRP